MQTQLLSMKSVTSAELDTAPAETLLNTNPYQFASIVHKTPFQKVKDTSKEVRSSSASKIELKKDAESPRSLDGSSSGKKGILKKNGKYSNFKLA